MRRVRGLVARVRASCTADGFFHRFEDRLDKERSYREFYARYETAFVSLPDLEWERLQAKAIEHYNDGRDGQWKQGFFHQLNEAFAFKYLIDRGADFVQFVDEQVRLRTPDLSYVAHGILCHCEVKTVGISAEEIDRRKGLAAFERVYDLFTNEFFRKLDSVIHGARDQIASANTAGLVFVMITPDDFSMTYDDEHQLQLQDYLDSRKLDDVVLRLSTTDMTFTRTSAQPL